MADEKKMKIAIVKDGPYLVSGNVPLAMEVAMRDTQNVPTEWVMTKKYPDQESYALCRCGASKKKPYCDGSHSAVHFDGTETASRKPFSEMAERDVGKRLDLLDYKELCGRAQFCHRAGGIWELVRTRDDEEAVRMAKEIAGQCPTGRLVVCDKEYHRHIEPRLEKGITVLEDPGRNCSGPLWVKGGIPVQSVDGTTYEVRNRMALCRCGESENKPFCDGTHISIGFSDRE